MSNLDDIQSLNKQLDFPKFSYSIFRENFAHHTPFSLHLSNQSTNKTMNFELNVKSKKQKLQLQHQMNLLWKVKQSQAILTRIRSNNYFKIHYDNGIQTWNNLHYNLYCSVSAKGHTGLSLSSLKGGLHLVGKYFQTDTRVKVYHFKSPDITLYNRSVFKYGIMRLGWAGSFQPKSKCLLRGAAVLGAEVNDNLSIFGRLENKGIKQKKQTASSLDVIYSIDQKKKIGLQINYCNYQDNKDNRINGEILLEAKVQHSAYFVNLVKLKVNGNLRTTWLFKFTTPILGDKVSHWLGICHPGIKSDQSGVKCGLRTEFNA